MTVKNLKINRASGNRRSGILSLHVGDAVGGTLDEVSQSAKK